MEQVQSEKLAVKRNALSVLCGEFSNPMSIRGCVEAGSDHLDSGGEAASLTRSHQQHRQMMSTQPTEPK